MCATTLHNMVENSQHSWLNMKSKIAHVNSHAAGFQILEKRLVWQRHAKMLQVFFEPLELFQAVCILAIVVEQYTRNLIVFVARVRWFDPIRIHVTNINAVISGSVIDANSSYRLCVCVCKYVYTHMPMNMFRHIWLMHVFAYECIVMYYACMHLYPYAYIYHSKHEYHLTVAIINLLFSKLLVQNTNSVLCILYREVLPMKEIQEM